jgi:hypothetical protein
MRRDGRGWRAPAAVFAQKGDVCGLLGWNALLGWLLIYAGAGADVGTVRLALGHGGASKVTTCEANISAVNAKAPEKFGLFSLRSTLQRTLHPFPERLAV